MCSSRSKQARQYLRQDRLSPRSDMSFLTATTLRWSQNYRGCGCAREISRQWGKGGKGRGKEPGAVVPAVLGRGPVCAHGRHEPGARGVVGRSGCLRVANSLTPHGARVGRGTGGTAGRGVGGDESGTAACGGGRRGRNNTSTALWELTPAYDMCTIQCRACNLDPPPPRGWALSQSRKAGEPKGRAFWCSSATGSRFPISAQRS